MIGVLCPNCKKILPASAHYCAHCGEVIVSPEHAFAAVSQGSQRNVPSSRPLPQIFSWEGEQYPALDEFDESLYEEPTHHSTWHKELAVPTSQVDVPLSPRPSQSRHIMFTRLPTRGQPHRGIIPPLLLFWASVVTVIVLLLGGIFGVFVTFGRELFPPTAGLHVPTLEVSSSSVAIGATLTLRGSNFTRHGHVGLTRDVMLPMVDTGGASIIQADGKGTFTDTVVVTSDWQTGMHVLNAEDAVLHKIARFSLLVTGRNTSLRPAHLNVSAPTLDLGTGDAATNSIQTLTLSNLGGGQIIWRSSTDQPWLLITPKQGTFTSGAKTQITVAGDRSSLKTGAYRAHLHIFSNAGDSQINVKMQVVPLNPGHGPVLGVNPAVLSFTATDGGTKPQAQTITISNPGVRPLQWRATTNAAWLSISPTTGNVQNTSPAGGVSISSTGQSSTQNVSVSIDTSTLLPGTYSGMITFSGQGTEQVKDSPQNVVVTITINPQCGLQVSSSLITFAGAHGQPSPPSKSISVGVSPGCTSPMQWSATTTAQWLVLSTSSGTTPASPSIGVNSAGLASGTYSGSIIFTTSTGTITIPVTFTLGPPTAPVMSVAATALAYSGIVGQASPASQSVLVTNTASGTLNWQATFATTDSYNWLNVAPTSGSLTSQQSATLTVTAAQLNTLVPGTYNGTVTITGTDGAGHTVPGSPQVIPVSFVVQAACTMTAGPAALAFTGVAGQTAPAPQFITITASGTCTHTVEWTATPAANANWLQPSPVSGIVTPSVAGKSSIGVVLANLAAGNYPSSLTITASDSVTHQAIGTPVVIRVALTVQSSCAVQTLSASTETFTTEAGQNPAAQTFSLTVSGVCTNSVTVTPTVTLGNGTGWLTVTPKTATILAGGTTAFTTTVLGTKMTAGSYNGSISLAATSGGGAIVGSPQNVGVTVNVTAPPILAASPGMIATNATGGVTSQPIDIANTGGNSLNWTATIVSAPAFVTLSPASGTLAANTDTTTGIVVNEATVTSGSYTATVAVSAIDSATGNATGGSPTIISITIIVAPPAMNVSATTLTFSASVGTPPASQTITITNVGGGTLTWSAGPPSASWLTVSPTSGSDAPNISSILTFSVNTTGLVAGTSYTATVVITPSTGPAVTVTVTLNIAAATPGPTPTATATAVPSPSPTTTVTAVPSPSPTTTVTTVPGPTPTVG